MGFFTGIQNLNFVPKSELTEMSPPKPKQISLQICRPKPMLFGFRSEFVSILLNGLKSFFWFSSVIPGPLSITLIESRNLFSSL